MVVGAGGWPPALAVRRDDGWARARVRRRHRAEPRPRSRHRPADGAGPIAARLRRARLTPTRALEFGLALSALSFVLLASLVNVLTALLALLGNLFYVFVYTRWLKRSTPQNIVIGGAAGAIPPLVGWAAATGNLTTAGAAAVRCRLLLDAAALLGARAADPARLRGRRRPDAARRAR